MNDRLAPEVDPAVKTSPPPYGCLRPRSFRARRLTGGQGHAPPLRMGRRRRPAPRGPGRWLRLVLGWALILIGVLGLVLPGIQGILTIAAGAALVGRQSRPLRWVMAVMRIATRRIAHGPGWVGRLGRFLVHQDRTLSRKLRHQRWRRSVPTEDRAGDSHTVC